MKSHKISIKLYVKPGTAPAGPSLVEVFHDWIKNDALPETMIDVTEYGHVHHGPAVLFVGHESDYALDMSEGRPGLLYVRKRAADPAEPGARLDDALRRVLRVASKLEAEARLAPLAFATDELLLRVLDRLRAPNDAATFTEEKDGIVRAVSRVFGDGVDVVRDGKDPREPFSVRIRTKSTEAVGAISARA